MKIRVADLIMKILTERGIADCFAVVGGGSMHLNNALLKNDRINKYFNHHEQACAMAAEAYARLSGKMAAVCVTCGPGGTNTLTGVMGAWQESLPLIVIAGQVRYETTIQYSGLELRHRGLQEFNIIDSIQNMTKYAVMISDPLEVERELNKAISLAMSGRRGPVWIDIPLDIQSAIIDTENLYKSAEKITVPVLTTEKFELICKYLEQAKRPCILAGSGIISSGSREKFHQLVGESKIPVVGGAWICDIHSMKKENYYGICGNIGPRVGNFIIQNSDLILVLGSSLSYRQTGFAQEKFAPNAKIIMIDIDKNEPLKPGLNIAEFINADLDSVLDKFNKEKYSFVISSEWVSYCQNLKQRFTPFEALGEKDAFIKNSRVRSYYFWKIFEKYAKKDTILALGNNTANAAKLQIGVYSPNQRVLTNNTCGSMGYDLPAAIGAAVASGREVICATGDGSIMMNLQELQTINHYNFPIKIIVFSNDGYNAIRQTCKNFFDGEYVGCTAESGVSFPQFRDIAKSFGFEYILCPNEESIEMSLERFYKSNKRVFMEVKQLLDDPIIPKVSSRMDNDGKFLTPALHDMYPFLKENELRELMISEMSNDKRICN